MGNNSIPTCKELGGGKQASRKLPNIFIKNKNFGKLEEVKKMNVLNYDNVTTL